jgi:hypothetical protein
MKIGFYCESPADQAALAIFTEGLLGEPPEAIHLEAHSVPGFFSALKGVFTGVYYTTDAEGLVVVVDSDDSVLHKADHDKPEARPDDCRLCKVRKIIDQARKHLKPRQGRPGLKVAIGLAVPAIEAWYLVGKNHQVGEAAWAATLSTSRRPFTRPQLKKLVYDTDRPSLEREIERAESEARRIVRDLTVIEAAFPVGFGLMAQEIRSWSVQPPKPTAE